MAPDGSLHQRARFQQPSPSPPTGSALLCARAARAVASPGGRPSVPRRAMDTAASMLVVDDDPDIRQALAELLAESGRRVATAKDGYDALEKLDSLDRPCVILLDLMMPRMSGLELLDHLSQQPSLEDVQVI